MGGGFAWVLFGISDAETYDVPGGGLARRASSQALIGGCGATFEFKGIARESGIVPATRPDGREARQAYRTIVPMFGKFWETGAPTPPASTGFWAPQDPEAPQAEELVRNLWDGWMVVYYTNAATPADIAALEKIATTQPEFKMLVAPWERRRGPLPSNRKIAYSVWGASQTCQRLVAPTIREFREAYPVSTAPGADGTPPPVITSSGPVSAPVPTFDPSGTPAVPSPSASVTN